MTLANEVINLTILSDFQTYLLLGWQHIADWTAYDHILFIIALCAAYRPQQWKNMAILVTAFTLGHSLTLALAILQIVVINSAWVEFLIPITIILTAGFNIFQKEDNTIQKQNFYLNYGLAFFFGLIHGLGFSNYLRMLLGKEETILQPLLAFNIGLEIGQICIVACIFAAMYLFLQILKVKHRDWKLVLSGAAAGIALTLLHLP